MVPRNDSPKERNSIDVGTEYPKGNLTDNSVLTVVVGTLTTSARGDSD